MFFFPPVMSDLERNEREKKKLDSPTQPPIPATLVDPPAHPSGIPPQASEDYRSVRDSSVADSASVLNSPSTVSRISGQQSTSR